MLIQFRDSHVFTGVRARLKVNEDEPQQGVAELEFSDGSLAQAQFNRLSATELQLWIRPYITAQGNAVSAHDWRMEATNAKGIWRVNRRGA